MGQEVAKVVKETPDIDVLCGVDKMDTGDNLFPVFTNVQDINLIPDVIIDFSIPEATLNILEFAKNNKIPTVIATTGFTDDQINLLNEYSEIFPIFRSANMSYEVNLMAKIVSEVAKKLTDSDIEIIETHHHRKIDSPSGTATMSMIDIQNEKKEIQKKLVFILLEVVQKLELIVLFSLEIMKN